MNNPRYNIMKWKFGPNTYDICGGIGTLWIPRFITCTRTLHEIVKVWTFHQIGPDTFTDVIDESEEIYDPDEPGFQHTCLGDSGGGHWMKEGGNGEKQVLIGVSSYATAQCGLASYMETINNKVALRWIKQWYQNV